MDHGSFHIRCQSEDCTIAYVFREMLVTNTEVSGAGVAGAVGDPGGHELKAGAESTSTVGQGGLCFWVSLGFRPVSISVDVQGCLEKSQHPCSRQHIHNSLRGKQPRCPLSDKQVDRSWYSHTVES